MMTRKDFEHLAKIIGAMHRTHDQGQTELALNNIQQDLVEWCAIDNPRFDLTRFAVAVQKERNRT